MVLGEDFNRAEDLRPARDVCKEQKCATGEKFWVLRVTLYQPAWVIDCIGSLLIWQGKDDTLHTETGRYYPATENEDTDGA